MPLVVRAIYPAYVSRKKLDRSIRDELEGVSFNSLVGVLQQLSSLAHHTEELFSELSKEAEAISERTSTLIARVDKLTLVVDALDPNEEQVALASANMRKPFKSTYASEQQVLSRSNLPKAVLKTYDDSKRPPNLRLMNAYRDDNKDAMKFYTDPQYFFDLWAKSVVEETQKRQKAHRDKKRHRREKKITQIEKKVYNAQGVEFGDVEYVKQPPVTVVPVAPIETKRYEEDDDLSDSQIVEKKSGDQSVVIADKPSVHYFHSPSPEVEDMDDRNDDDDDIPTPRSPILPPPPQPFSLDEYHDQFEYSQDNRHHHPQQQQQGQHHHEQMLAKQPPNYQDIDNTQRNIQSNTPVQSSRVNFATTDVTIDETPVAPQSHSTLSLPPYPSPIPDQSTINQSVNQLQTSLVASSPMIDADDLPQPELPPPPPQSMIAPPAPPAMDESASVTAKVQPKIASEGSTLLKAIQSKKLRKVQDDGPEKRERRPTGIFGSDVEELLKRRQFLQCSSDEDDGESSAESEWNESDDAGYFN